MLREARHAREDGEAAVRAAEHADALTVDPVLGAKPLRSGLPVLQVDVAPVTVDHPLVRLAVAGRAADVRREDADPARAEILRERLVARALLRLGAAVDVQHDRVRPVDGRTEQPGGDVEPVPARVRRELRLDHRVRRRQADAAVGHALCLAGRRVDDVDVLPEPRLVPQDGDARAVRRDGEHRVVLMRRARRELRVGTVADAKLRPAAIVLEPRDDTAVGRSGEPFDVCARLLDVRPAAGTQVVVREAPELGAGVGDEVEPRAVGGPGPRHELRRLVVERQLLRGAADEVDQVQRLVGVRAVLERQESRSVRREAGGERVHAFSEDRARLAAVHGLQPHL